MGCPFPQEAASDEVERLVVAQQYQSWCELVYIGSEILQCASCGMEIWMSVLAYQVDKILEVAKQQSQLGVSGALLKHVQQLKDCLLPANPLTETSAGSSPSARQQTARQQNSKAGSKRGLREAAMFQHDCCALSIPERSSKRVKHLERVHFNAQKTWLGDSCCGGRNPSPEHWNGEECIKSRYEGSAFICYKDKSQYIRKEIVPDSLPGNEVCKSVASGILSKILNSLCKYVPRFSNKKSTVSAQGKRVQVPKRIEKPVTGWHALPYDIQENVLHRLGFDDLFRFKILSKTCKEVIESEALCKARGATSSPEGLFTAINYYIKNKTWRCSGFDLHSQTWRSLPTFSPTLQAPEAELFKEYSVCGHGGLMCADVSKLPKKGELIVFNPLTRKKRALPSLIYPRSPVLVHLSINSVTKSYKVIAAGSSTASDEHLSKKVEIFDSKTSQWEVAPDLPGPAFGLNEHQAGVCVDAVLYFISFLEGDCRRSVVAFDVEHKKWLDHKACPIPFSMNSNTLQLVETGGNVYLFSEQERGGSVEHCIDVLERPSRASEKCKWRNVVRVKKSGGRGLQVYPEHTCVSFGDGKLCVFNTLTRDGVVYDMQDGKQVEVLPPPPPDQKGDNFFSLNPTSFTLQPSFDSDPMPLIVDPN